MTKVPVGPGTIASYILTALAAGGSVIAAAEHEMSGSGKWLAITSAAIAVLTHFNRSLQAKTQPEEAPSEGV